LPIGGSEKTAGDASPDARRANLVIPAKAGIQLRCCFG
jgi:hypothetical protein